MKVSKNKLNEYIQLYLNDLEDYGDSQADLLIAESTLNTFKLLLVESNQDVSTILREAITKSEHEQREVFEDFLNYLENI
jgi:hypothetical protein